MQQLYNEVCARAAFTTPARSQETSGDSHPSYSTLLRICCHFLTCCEDKAQQMFMSSVGRPELHQTSAYQTLVNERV